MAERWTAKTQDLVLFAMWAAENDAGRVGHMTPDDARAVLTALVDAGLLITPQHQAVLDAARKWAGPMRLPHAVSLSTSSASADLLAAVDALGGERL